MKYLLLTFVLLPSLTLAAFNDINKNHAHHDAINYLQQQGIINGYNDGTFKPSNTINRAEFTKIITEAQFTKTQINACKTNGGFSDVSRNTWFAPYVCVAKNEAIINGYPDGTFGPGNQILLSEAAKIVAHSFKLTVDQKLQPWYAPYLQRLTDLNVVPPSIIDPSDALNRGEMAEIIYRLKTNKTNEPASQIIFKTANQPVKTTDLDPHQAQTLLELTNTARAKAGLSTLTFDPILNQVAQDFAEQMDTEKFFNHIDPDGNGPDKRATITGYKWSHIGENIAKGQTTAQFAFDTWKNSPGHWANILKPEYKEIGIGQFKVTNDSFYKGYFWVQVFGTKQ